MRVKLNSGSPSDELLEAVFAIFGRAVYDARGQQQGCAFNNAYLFCNFKSEIVPGGRSGCGQHYSPASLKNLRNRLVRPRLSATLYFARIAERMPKAVHPKESKPSISIIGSGRLGTALAIALASSGYPIQAVVARRLTTARKAAALVSRRPLALRASQLDRLPPSKIVLLTTPDDEIAGTAQRLADSHGGLLKGSIVLHTSGALSSDVLKPLTGVGFHVGSLHPLVSVSDPVTGQKTLCGAFYCIEGDAAACRTARAIVRNLQGHSFAVPSHYKPLYHAAAVMTAGHVLALYDLATEMLVQCGLKRGDALRILLPLLKSTVSNLSRSDPARALTGTFARGDVATVRRHLQALSNNGLLQALEVYRLLGARSLQLAVGNGLEPKLARQIKQVLIANTKK